jgi:hypothetical protein
LASGEDLVTYLQTLWTIQTIIVALVYPIVLAFVAVLVSFERYAVHIALPREIRGYLRVHILQQGQKLGLLPGQSSYLAFELGNTVEPDPGPKINLLRFGDGEECVPIHLRRRRQIVDVRLRLLRWGLDLWLARSRKSWEETKLEEGDTAEPVLGFRIAPGDVLMGARTLFRVKNAPGPAGLSRILLRWAFLFGPPPEPGRSYPTRELLRELIDDLVAATESGSYEAIRERLLAVSHVHAALLDAGRFVADDGSKANAALVVDPAGFGQTSSGSSWVSEYSRWLEESVGQIGSNSHAFVQASHLTGRMLRDLEPDPLRIPIELLRIHRALFFYLGKWWTRRVDEQGDVVHDASREAKLRPPFAGLYQRALQGAIGGWEQIDIRAKDSRVGTREEAWATESRKARFVRKHLEETCELLVEAVSRGDLQAARIFADSFLTWPNRTGHRYNLHQPIYQSCGPQPPTARSTFMPYLPMLPMLPMRHSHRRAWMVFARPPRAASICSSRIMRATSDKICKGI